jgi:hypothetical protein
MSTAIATGPTASGTVPDAARQIDDEFLALVYADPALLRAEFDAIIAAAWSSPPPPDHTPPADAEPPPGRAVPDPPRNEFFRPSVHGGFRQRGARTRSPPHRPDP